MEAGTGDVNLAWTNIDSLSGQKLMRNTIFGNFQCEEMAPLYEYLKEESRSERPLIYTGFDSQMSSSYFFTHLQNILYSYNKPFAGTLREGYAHYYKQAGAGKNSDSLNYIKYRNAFLDVVALVLNRSIMKIQLTFLCVLLSFFCKGQDQILTESAPFIHTFETVDAKGFKDVIWDLAKDKTIIGLGEVSHYTKECYV